MGVVTGRQPRIRAQIGNLNCVVLLDSGSSRSIISERHFQLLNRGGQDFKLFDTELTCMTASGHNLEIMGEVRATLRINKFSWPWRFLVGKKLKGQPILGVDFISRSNLVLDLGKSSCYFRFAAGVQIPFCESAGRSSSLYNICVDNNSPAVQCGKISPRQKKEIELIVQKYPDVLTSRLDLTNVLQYDI